MKKILNTLVIIFVITFFVGPLQAQVNFESLSVDTATKFWKGNAGVPGLIPFYSGPAVFVNRNDTSSFGDYWSGWAYSAENDTNSIDYLTNDCAAIAGKGHSQSDKYGVAYVNSFDASLNLIKLPFFNSLVSGFYVTNTTIAYRSMQNGDGFAKKFGGLSGNDADFFRLDITGWYQGIAKSDTVHFYLADFRDTNNANDYIIKDWTFVDLTALGIADSLTYSLASSDMGSFGMNTPAYFCMDDMSVAPVGLAENKIFDAIKMYPNPFINEVMIQNTGGANLDAEVLSINGMRIFCSTIYSQQTVKINCASWASGNYIFKLSDGKQTSYHKMVK